MNIKRNNTFCPLVLLLTSFLFLPAIVFADPPGRPKHTEFPKAGNGPGVQRMNIDFGPWKPSPSEQTGPAAVGLAGDFWNTVGVAWNDDHTEGEIKWSNGEPSEIKVRMVNLAGGWGCSHRLGVKDPMLDDFNYPQNNQGGDSLVVLSNVPDGLYDLYLYGKGTDPVYVGDYELKVGGRGRGRKAVSKDFDAVAETEWVENGQYVKYTGFAVEPGETVEILIRPGGLVSDGGRVFADSVINGLQLVRIK